MSAFRRRRPLASGLVTAILTLTIPICATEAGERRVCLLDLQILGAGAGLLCTGDDMKTPVVIDTACQAFEPIRYSRKTDPETARQIREHNAAWDALCKGK